MEHERQLDSSIACAEAKSSDDHSRLRGCKGFGHLAGWKALARAQGDVKMMRNGQFCKLTTDIYIYNMIICVLHYVCCFRSPTETLHSRNVMFGAFSHNRLGPRSWTVCRSISSLDLWRSWTVDCMTPHEEKIWEDQYEMAVFDNYC